jgi:AmmeMemoRadiSam system protein B
MTGSKSQAIRRAVIAGSWYPGTRRSLARTVDDYLAGVDQPLLAGDLVGLVSPHAGYPFSGQTAAHAFRQLEGRAVDTVVLVGPSHRAWVGDYVASGEDAYETPLGLVPLDKGFIAALGHRSPLRLVHGDAEHSLEIQLPFLQRQLDRFRLVPIMMGTDDPAVAQRLAQLLVETIRARSAAEGPVLLVASSDLHHIQNYDEVVRRDQPVVDAIAAFDLPGLTPLLLERNCSVCGRMPILTILHACQALGADAVQVLHHTNSGDVTGQRSPGQYTVGYMAAAVLRSQ